jgi:tetratricopeptide (TPR) repeat protein
MSSRRRLEIVALAVLVVGLTFAGQASAQNMGVLTGRVLDEAGNPIVGASITAENPRATGTKTAETNENGEFTLVGMRGGQWSLTFEADGYLPAQARTQVAGLSGERNRPLTVQLVAGIAAPPGMEGVGTEEIKADLDAANALFDQQDFAGALAAYEALSEMLPDLSAIRMQIANVHRQVKDYDKAIAEYDSIIAKEPTNHRAKMERAMTNLIKGDLTAAEAGLSEMAQLPTASAEVFYNLGEVKFAQGSAEDAGIWYERAAEKNPNWGKPLFKLALVALNKADNEGAAAILQRVIEAEPNSQEAGQAKLILEQLKPQ